MGRDAEEASWCGIDGFRIIFGTRSENACCCGLRGMVVDVGASDRMDGQEPIVAAAKGGIGWITIVRGSEVDTRWPH